jgi:hypothetical protein
MKRKSDEIVGVESMVSTPPKRIKGIPKITEIVENQLIQARNDLTS